MGCLASAIINLLFLNAADGKYVAVMGISTVGIVVFAYYFNEAHWGCMDIIKKLCACLTIFVITELYYTLENDVITIWDQVKRSIVIMAFIVWGSISVSVGLGDPIHISEM